MTRTVHRAVLGPVTRLALASFIKFPPPARALPLRARVRYRWLYITVPNRDIHAVGRVAYVEIIDAHEQVIYTNLTSALDPGANIDYAHELIRSLAGEK